MSIETAQSLADQSEKLFRTSGELQYAIEVNKAHLSQINQQILELNQKAHALKNPPAAPVETVPEPTPPVTE